jgi:hypothetical protein
LLTRVAGSTRKGRQPVQLTRSEVTTESIITRVDISLTNRNACNRLSHFSCLRQISLIQQSTSWNLQQFIGLHLYQLDDMCRVILVSSVPYFASLRGGSALLLDNILTSWKSFDFVFLDMTGDVRLPARAYSAFRRSKALVNVQL